MSLFLFSEDQKRAKREGSHCIPKYLEILELGIPICICNLWEWAFRRLGHLWPSGMVSSSLNPAEKTSNLLNFPIDLGMPAKSNSFPFKYRARTCGNFDREAGSRGRQNAKHGLTWIFKRAFAKYFDLKFFSVESSQIF